MSEIKIFRIEGEYSKGYQKYVFSKEKRALKEEDALEDVLSEITSIGLLRRQVKIHDISEIKEEEVTDPLIMQLINDQ